MEPQVIAVVVGSSMSAFVVLMCLLFYYATRLGVAAFIFFVFLALYPWWIFILWSPGFWIMLSSMFVLLLFCFEQGPMSTQRYVMASKNDAGPSQHEFTKGEGRGKK